jgi:para-nitrobenzyl esterase
MMHHERAIDSVVETTNGKLRGSVENGVYVFKGVRYVDTTGGANRFMPPRPPKPWAGIQDALEWGASGGGARETA